MVCRRHMELAILKFLSFILHGPLNTRCSRVCLAPSPFPLFVPLVHNLLSRSSSTFLHFSPELLHLPPLVNRAPLITRVT